MEYCHTRVYLKTLLPLLLSNLSPLPDPFSVKDVPDARHLTQTEDQRPEAAEQLKRERRYGNSGKPGVVTHSADESQFEYSEPYFCVRIYHM